MGTINWSSHNKSACIYSLFFSSPMCYIQNTIDACRYYSSLYLQFLRASQRWLMAEIRGISHTCRIRVLTNVLCTNQIIPNIAVKHQPRRAVTRKNDLLRAEPYIGSSDIGDDWSGQVTFGCSGRARWVINHSEKKCMLSIYFVGTCFGHPVGLRVGPMRAWKTPSSILDCRECNEECRLYAENFRN